MVSPSRSTAAPRRRARGLDEFYSRRRAVLRAIVLIFATALSLLGTVGQFYFVDSQQEIAEARAEEMRKIVMRTEILRTSQSAYFNAQVQANMLFALNPADRSVNKGIVGDLYQLALHDRAFPFRSILGQLAIAGAIEFKAVNEEYNRIRERAMKDFSYEPFMAVGAFEQQVIDEAMNLNGELQERYGAADAEKAAAEKSAEHRRAILLALAGLATCLFLIANLMGARD